MPECRKCGKQFTRSDHLKRHESTVCGGDKTNDLKCPKCTYHSNRKDNLDRHRRMFHGETLPKKRREDVLPGSSSPNELVTQENDNAAPADRGTFQEPCNVGDDPQDQNAIDKVLSMNRTRIETRYERTTRHQDRYNFEVFTANLFEITSFVKKIFREQETAFKLNVSFGFVLQDVLTSQFVYYYASRNNRLFDKPILMRDLSDIERFKKAFDKEDLLEYCRQQRPNTKFIVRCITNAYFYVDKLKLHPIGSATALPNFVKNKKSVVSFEKDKHGTLYADNLCLFRCIAYHLNRTFASIEQRARSLLYEYVGNSAIDVKEFEGVNLSELQRVEDLFQIDIEVFSLERKNSRTYARKVRSSRLKYGTKLLLNLYGNHFSLIKNMGVYSQEWICGKCRRFFCSPWSHAVTYSKL